MSEALCWQPENTVVWCFLAGMHLLSKGGKASPPTQPLRFDCSSGPCCLPDFFSRFGIPEGYLCSTAAFPILSFMGFLLCVGKLCLWLGIKNRSISANLILP